MGKYYFISFMYGASEKRECNSLIDRHPLLWQRVCNEIYPGQYVLTNWKEVSEKDYVIFKEHMMDY